MAKKKASPGWVVVALIVAGISWYLKQGEKEFGAVVSEKAELAHVEAKPAKKNHSASAKTARAGGFEVLEGCRLVNSHRNDGDSFFVKHAEGETEFRLYFVDAPESKYKEYRDGNNNGERLRHQGDYFGGLDRDSTVDVGVKAKKCVRELLGSKPFTVMTKWESVYGSARMYAFVVVEDAGREKFLHEVLVEKGLGRIHTLGVDLPNGMSFRKQKDRLRGIEAQAKKARIGAWAM